MMPLAVQSTVLPSDDRKVDWRKLSEKAGAEVEVGSAGGEAA